VSPPKDGKHSGLMLAELNCLLKYVLYKSPGYYPENVILINSNDKERTGALSDGLHWAIWHNCELQWYIADFETHSKEDSFILLSNRLFFFFFFANHQRF
jgi:hypothetical protein